jgi:hypothetical protein
MAQENKNINPRIALVLKIAVAMNLLVLVSYGMEMDKTEIQEQTFYNLSFDTRDLILNRFFTTKLKYHGGAKLKCRHSTNRTMALLYLVLVETLYIAKHSDCAMY